MWLLALACAPTPEPAAAADPPPEGYAALLGRLDARAEALRARARAGEDRAKLRAEARRVVLDAITTELFPAWAGTPWAFYGVTEVPGEGEIACGYFVSTVLRDAGFDVERVALAQQPAEWIERTFVPAAQLRRFRHRPPREVVASLDGEGLWLVGLDFHVGFLWSDGEAVRMCHSSPFGDGVVCEDAATAQGMVSDLHVVAPLLGDDVVDRWLADAPFPTYAGR